MVLGCRRFRECCNERSWLVLRKTRGGESKLGLGPVAYRLDDSAPCGGGGDDGFHGDQDTGPAGKPGPRSLEADRSSDLHDRSGWTSIGRAARHRVHNLGGGVLVAWCSRLVPGRLALLCRLDEHTRCNAADAGTTL